VPVLETGSREAGNLQSAIKLTHCEQVAHESPPIADIKIMKKTD